MFQGWRFKLREAEEAYEHGQLDEACRLLRQADLHQYLPGKRLGVRVACGLAERARRRVIHGDLVSGWQDLASAQSLVGESGDVLAARQEIVAVVVGEAEAHVAAGETARAVALMEQLERHDVKDESVRRVKEVARRLESAQRLARLGNFSEAAAHLRTADAMCPHVTVVATLRQEYEGKADPFRQLTESLHRAVASQQWTDAASIADRALALAPENHLARDVRRRAWAQVGAGQAASAAVTATALRGNNRTNGQRPEPQQDGHASAPPERKEPRFLLWVDGIGGFLVCLADEVVLGQATFQSRIDVPLQADLSRQHAKIARRGDGYVIEPYHEARINGQVMRGRTLLSDGDEIELGKTVRLRFRQPHALSASARLEFASNHRTQPAVDAVLLMAESCVLGPKWQNHVVCPDWHSDVVLYRRDGALFCRAMESIEIDGQLCDGRGQLGLNSHVTGGDFSLSLEELA
ncbi:MAG: FHA domain-containing protein [Planctomycetes bacterium]|nr:FHA domain-containing protein [Planctomycetota bacterium]